VLQAARAFANDGTVPPGVDMPQVFLDSRSGYFLADPAVDWLEAYEAQLAQCVRPADTAAPAVAAGTAAMAK
jgi:phthalate 4,5-dioxygenase